jgi:phosphotransferase system HPr (HPr) family protein
VDATPPRPDPAPVPVVGSGVADESGAGPGTGTGGGGAARAQVVVGARQGLHARPAARLVETAKRFQAEVRIQHGTTRGSAKDLLDVLYLAAPQGAVLVVEASGPDAAEAVEAIVALLALLSGEDGP